MNTRSLNRLQVKLQLLRNGEASLIGMLHLKLLESFGFPNLLLRWPQTIFQLGSALFKRYSFPVYAFTTYDLWLRTYYSKLARNFRQVGRWGYVWEESLGFPMGPRFGTNWATYTLYGRLSPQAFSFLSLTLYLSGLLVVGFISGHVSLAFALFLLLLTSPFAVFSLVSFRVKPEIIWWSFAIPALFAALTHEWTTVWILLGAVLLANTSVSIILGSMLIGPWLCSVSQGQFTFGYNYLYLLPGLLVRTYRIWYAYRDGGLTGVVEEQQAVQKNNRKIRKHFIKVFLILFLILVASWHYWPQGLALGIPLAILYLANIYWFKFADVVTFRSAQVSAILAVGLYSGEWVSVLIAFWVLYSAPFHIASLTGGQKRLARLQDVAEDRHRKLAEFRKLSRDYPWLSPMGFPNSPGLMDLFDCIPNGSRFLLEGLGNPRSDPRKGGSFVQFHDWTNGFLPNRQIEFMNHTFMLRMLEPALAERYLHKFSATTLQYDIMHEVCSSLGVSHVIAYTHETISALEKLGYTRLMTVSHQDFAELADMLYMPEVDLTLLSNPEPTGVISPDILWSRDRNTITWKAEAGQEYILRYRFHPNFAAMQGSKPLPVEVCHPFEDLPLRFMQVQAVQDGSLEVKFVPRIIP